MKNLLVSLTFDDGYRSQFQNACPILDEYGYKATFYCITKYVKEYSGDHMTERNLLQLHKHGHEIGAHTVTHPNLILQFWKRDEILQSKRELEDALGISIQSFAYPYGRYNERIVKRVQDAGYKNARVVKGEYNGYNRAITSRYKICCKEVKWNTTLQDIEKWIDEAVRNEFWLVFVFHQISCNHYTWGCTPTLLESICMLLSDSHNSTVCTVSEACELYH